MEGVGDAAEFGYTVSFFWRSGVGKVRVADKDRGWLANKGLRGEAEKVEEKGVGVRSERTDVQVIG